MRRVGIRHFLIGRLLAAAFVVIIHGHNEFSEALELLEILAAYVLRRMAECKYALACLLLGLSMSSALGQGGDEFLEERRMSARPIGPLVSVNTQLYMMFWAGFIAR